MKISLISFNGSKKQFYKRGVSFIYDDHGVVVKARTRQRIKVSVNGNAVSIPKGFEWDGSSLPRGKIFSVGNPFDYLLAGMVHDYLYRMQRFSRIFADAAYRDTMLYEGSEEWRASSRYYILRFLGWKAWNDNKNKRKRML